MTDFVNVTRVSGLYQVWLIAVIREHKVQLRTVPDVNTWVLKWFRISVCIAEYNRFIFLLFCFLRCIQRPRHAFQRGQKLEAVDQRNPTLVRAATVVDVLDYHICIHYDGWNAVYDDWFDADSTDLHPVEWCNKTEHPLEPPLSKSLVTKRISVRIDWTKTRFPTERFFVLTHNDL